MGYIIKAPTGGGGGGDATAANQTTQINEALTTNTYLNNPGTGSVFSDTTNASVFKTINNESIISRANVTITGITNCQGFTATSVTNLATAIKAFISASPIVIINIVYADNGINHTAIVTYNPI